MWKKTDDAQHPETAPASSPGAGRPQAHREVATIGPSITIKGDLSGEEDLIILGRLEGQISLRKNRVTVGKTGRVKADIYGKSIHVDGEVKGNLYGDQEVVIRDSGRMNGNIVSPRVTLENGSKFKGSIDMDAASRAAAKGESAAQKKPTPTPSGGGGDVKPGLKPGAATAQ